MKNTMDDGLYGYYLAKEDEWRGSRGSDFVNEFNRRLKEWAGDRIYGRSLWEVIQVQIISKAHQRGIDPIEFMDLLFAQKTIHEFMHVFQN